jgi:hypothetical protein
MLLVVISLGGCVATSQATSPTVVAIPGRFQSYEGFQTFDTNCRVYAQYRSGKPLGDYDAQQRYDLAYSKCMTARGAVVDSRLVPPGYPYPNPSYPWSPGVIVY